MIALADGSLWEGEPDRALVHWIVGDAMAVFAAWQQAPQEDHTDNVYQLVSHTFEGLQNQKCRFCTLRLRESLPYAITSSKKA